MKDDAFDDVRCPFDYRAELKRAREVLNEKVRECASRNWKMGYRQLARLFNLSPGSLYAIAGGCKPKCKPGPRSREQHIEERQLRSAIRRDIRR